MAEWLAMPARKRRVLGSIPDGDKTFSEVLIISNNTLLIVLRLN